MAQPPVCFQERQRCDGLVRAVTKRWVSKPYPPSQKHMLAYVREVALAFKQRKIHQPGLKIEGIDWLLQRVCFRFC